MAKQNRTNQDAIAKALSEAYDKVSSTGDFVTQCVTLAKRFYKGKDIPSDHIAYILDKLTVLRKWSDASAKARRSEAKNILSHYAVLPEAVSALRKKVGTCTWHQVVTLARELGRHKGKRQIPAAVNAMVSKRKAETVSPGHVSRKDAKGKAAQAIKRVLLYTKIEKGFRDDLAALCEDYGIRV